jgi:mycofactocin precursor
MDTGLPKQTITEPVEQLDELDTSGVEALIADELVVEDVSIDGICGVY